MSLEVFQIKHIDYEKMEKQKVSIVLTTFRKNPKLELMLECLSRQTVKNFEFVLVDWLFEQRQDYIKKLSEKYKIPIVHVGRDTKGASRAMNIGIINSSGDYILHINDCTYITNRWVEKHLLICMNNAMGLGPRYFVFSNDFPIEKYLTGYINIPAELEKDKLDWIYKRTGVDKYLIVQMGEHQIVSPQDLRLIGLPNDFIEGENIILSVLPGHSYGGNMSAPTEMYLEVNGFNEELDNGYGYPDCELGIRLYNNKKKLFLNTSNWFVEVQDKDHEDVFSFIPKMNNEEAFNHNLKLYEKACNENKTWVNLNINLREIRKKILEGKYKNGNK